MIVTTRYPKISITMKSQICTFTSPKILWSMSKGTPMMSILVRQFQRWRLLLSTSVCPYLQMQTVLRTEIVNRISRMQSRKKTLSKQTSKYGSSYFDAGGKDKSLFYILCDFNYVRIFGFSETLWCLFLKMRRVKDILVITSKN